MNLGEHSQGARWEIENTLLYLRLPNGSVVVPSAEEIFSISHEGRASGRLSELSFASPLPDLNFSKYPLDLDLSIEADEGGDVKSLRVVVLAKRAEFCKVIPDAEAREADHLVAEGVWFPFSPGSLDEIRDVLRSAAISGPGSISLRQYLSLLRLSTLHPLIHDRSGGSASALRQRARVDQGDPPGFLGKLYPFQYDGWRWLQLITRQGLGGILADEMGLGKTVQVAALLSSEIHSGGVPCLIVAPGTILENWNRELCRFLSRASVVVHHGSDRTGLPRELRTYDIVITSFDTLARDLPMFRSVQWNLVIIDEAQAIRNAETKRAVAVKRIPRRVGIAVTGTPIENRLSDLWSIADFVIPGFLGDYPAFERRFANDDAGAVQLEPVVSPILLRRRVADVARDLPERIEIPQVLELGRVQAAAYEQLRLGILEEYGKSASLVALTRLRMFCTHPMLVGSKQRDPIAESPKYERLCEILEEVRCVGEKALVFTSFTGMIDLLARDLARRLGVSVEVIDGRTAIDSRQVTVDRFSAYEGPSVLVLNPRAAGIGLNITAANHVIHYNLEWNPAVEDQASARAYRRGQLRPVTIHRLFYVDTVEEVIDERLSGKRSLSRRAIVGVDGTEDNLSEIAHALARSPLKGDA